MTQDMYIPSKAPLKSIPRLPYDHGCEWFVHVWYSYGATAGLGRSRPVTVLKCGRTAAVFKNRRQLTRNGRFHRGLHFSAKSANGGLQNTPVSGPEKRHRRVWVEASICGHGAAAGQLQTVSLAVQIVRKPPLALTFSRISMIAWPHG